MSTETPTAARPWTREWFCEGHPAPGGSKSAFVPRRRDGSVVTGPGGRIVVNMVDAGGEANKVWRKVVAFTAKMYWRVAPTDRPCEVQFIFFLRRPKGHWGSGRNAGHLLPSAPAYHAQKPDALKLARSTEDALTGIVWVDDSQVIRQVAEKRWAGAQDKTGAIIRVRIL